MFIRRIHPSLIANSIVSIQPMTAPVGGVFYMDYTFGSIENSLRSLFEDNTGNQKQNVRKGLASIIRNYDPKFVRQIVVEKFPEWLELLDKLLVLK